MHGPRFRKNKANSKQNNLCHALTSMGYSQVGQCRQSSHILPRQCTRKLRVISQNSVTASHSQLEYGICKLTYESILSACLASLERFPGVCCYAACCNRSKNKLNHLHEIKLHSSATGCSSALRVEQEPRVHRQWKVTLIRLDVSMSCSLVHATGCRCHRPAADHWPTLYSQSSLSLLQINSSRSVYGPIRAVPAAWYNSHNTLKRIHQSHQGE